MALAGLMLVPLAPGNASARQVAAMRRSPAVTTAVTAALPGTFNLPVPARNQNGRLEIFSIGSDGQLWHNWQLARNGTSGWSGWFSLGGNLNQSLAPAVGVNADGRLEVFAISTGKLWHIWQLAPNGTSGWSGWQSLGGPGPDGYAYSEPAVARNIDGDLSVFVRGSGNQIYYRTQFLSGWGSWLTIYRRTGDNWHPFGSPTVGVNLDGRLEVFVGDEYAKLRHAWQTAPSGSWSGWLSLDGWVGSLPIVGRNSDGRLEVFIRHQVTAGMWHIWQRYPNGSTGWSGWEPMGGAWAANPAVGRNLDGRLELFAIRASDQSLWHIWQTTANGGWTTAGFQLLGAGPWTRSPTVASNYDGRLEVFVVGAGGRVYHRWQTLPNGPSGWGPWAVL